jgi:hypothetical protein
VSEHFKLTPAQQDLVERLKIRAAIRRQAKDRKSAEREEPDRLADLLDEAAGEILHLRGRVLQSWSY